uniref:Transposase n=1 Tax=Acrobeloides nanus TaxID=290746 RepID=A0A914D739_9BILA
MASHRNTLRARVYNFYSKNIQSGKLYTVRHFMAEEVPKTTLYDILRRYDNNLPATRQLGSGGSNAKLTSRNLATLKRQFDNKDGFLQRQAAKRFQCGLATINRSLKKLNIKPARRNAFHIEMKGSNPIPSLLSN